MGKKILMAGKTTTGASSVANFSSSSVKFDGTRVVQAWGSVSSATGTAAIDIEGSTDGTVYTQLATINLTLGTTVVSGKASIADPWPFIRANVTAISGTGAAVSANLAD